MAGSFDIHVYPTALRARFAQIEALERSHAPCGQGARFLGFTAFLNELAQDVEERSPLLGPVASKLLLLHTVDAFYRDRTDAYFGPIAARPGFVEALHRLFSDLKSAFVDPERFRSLLQRVSMADSKREELGGLFQRFETAKKEQGRADVTDLRQQILTQLNRSPASFRLLRNARSIVFHGLYDLDAFRIELFRALSLGVPVRVLLPLPQERSRLFRYLDRCWGSFERLQEAAGDLLPEALPPDEERDPDTAAFLDALFQHPLSRAPETVRVFEAFSRYREVEEIAARIVRRMEAGVSPREIGVVFRSLSVYGPIVEDVFTRYRIPFLFRRGNPLRAAPLTRFFLAPFDIIESGFHREQVLKWITSSYAAGLDGEGEGYLPTAAELEEAVLSTGIIRGDLREWNARVQARVERVRKGEDPRHLLPVLEHLLSRRLPVLEAFEPLRRASSLPGFLEAFAALVDRLRPAGLFDPEPPFFVLHRDLSAYELLRSEVRRILREAQSFSFPTGDRTYAMGKHLLLEALDARNIPPPRFGRLDLVSVLSAEESTSYRFRHVYIGGLVEGEFPPPPERDPLLRDSERKELARCYLEMHRREKGEAGSPPPLFSRFADQWDRERLLFYLAADTARHTVTFSYPLVDLAGESLLRSSFLEDVLETLGGEERIERGAVLEVDTPLEHTFTFHTWVNKTVLAGKAAPDSSSARLLRQNAPGLLESIHERIRMEEERDRFFRLLAAGEPLHEIRNPYSGYIDEGIPKSDFSVTELDGYGTCPFAYYLAHVLELRPAERREVEEDVPAVGKAVHRILQRFHDQPDPEEPLEARKHRMQRTVEEVLAQVEAESPELCGDRRLWEIQRKKIRLLLDFYVEWDERRPTRGIPRFTEWDLCGEKGLLLPDVPEQGSTCAIRGRIDRVDFDPEHNTFWVWDYKLSHNHAHYREQLKPERMGTHSFQIPLYVLGVAGYVKREHGRKGGLPRIKGGYILLRNIARDEKKGVVAMDARSEVDRWILDPRRPWVTRHGETLPPFLSRLSDTLGRIRSGCFPPAPSLAHACDYCPFSAVCRYQYIPPPTNREDRP